MGGGSLRGLTRRVCATLVGAFVGAAAFFTPPTLRTDAASNGLDLVRDLVYSTEPGIANVDHNIYFVLPIDSQQVTPSDWILVEMPYYSNVTAPIGSEGGSGTPSYSVQGHVARVTGVSLLPGASFNIQGITASTPPAGESQQVIIKIAEDAAGTLVRNQAMTLPIAQGGYVSVSATVETILSSINLSGFTGPNSFTTLTENGNVIGTTVSGGTGNFVFVVNALAPGAHTYTIFSTDVTGRGTTQTTLNLFLLASTTTTVTGILLSPTIEIDVAEIDPGETVTVNGIAKPNSQINIFLEAPLRSYTTSTDIAGIWSFTLSSTETASLLPGQYIIYTNVQDGLGSQSITSPTVTFRVLSPNTSNPPPACNISRGDLNCDSVTNLVDFSILLFHWQTNHAVADINGDGRVNLTDFSIMMFYFTR